MANVYTENVYIYVYIYIRHLNEVELAILKIGWFLFVISVIA